VRRKRKREKAKPAIRKTSETLNLASERRLFLRALKITHFFFFFIFFLLGMVLKK
jgi:hypothetical protein